MLAPLIAIFATQVQPVTIAPKPLVKAPMVRTISPALRKDRLIADGRALVARAEAVSGSYAPATGQPTKTELDGQIDQIKSDLDSMSKMGEMESLRLQMAMDRLSKMMSTLSNLLKKISDTQDAIVQNIK